MSNPKEPRKRDYTAFQLLEPITVAPADVLDFAREFIAKNRWIYAKTMPEHPHEYCLRVNCVKNGTEEEFVRFAELIRQHGYRGRFHKTRLTYMNVDDWRYWSMGAPINRYPNGPPFPGAREPWGMAETTLINRARNDDLPLPCCSLSMATGGKHHALSCRNSEAA